MRSGVRQVPEAGRRLSAAMAMESPMLARRSKSRSEALQQLMHPHENPKRGAGIPAQDRPAKSTPTAFGPNRPRLFRSKEDYVSGQGKLRRLVRCSPKRRISQLPFHASLLRRALCSLGKLRRNLRGLGRRAPARRLAAVTPGARPVEGVHAKFVHLLHFAHP